MPNRLICGDCLEVLSGMETDSVDLILGSPPYEAARTYGIDFKLKGQDWVDWMVERTLQMSRVSRGLVTMVVEGQTRKFRYSATPILLMADLHRAGVHLRKPPVYRRNGIPGSGGPDWLRNDWEFIVCCTSGGRLPWSDNTVMGKPPKYKTGGACTNRHADGRRINKQKGVGRSRKYAMPKIANPGNVIDCGSAGGGHMGNTLAHENEAPFPEHLAEFFVRSFCPPGGVVLDPFSGSGTTGAVAQRWGRNYIGIDVRDSQIELTERRIAEEQPQKEAA